MRKRWTQDVSSPRILPTTERNTSMQLKRVAFTMYPVTDVPRAVRARNDG